MNCIIVLTWYDVDNTELTTAESYCTNDEVVGAFLEDDDLYDMLIKKLCDIESTLHVRSCRIEYYCTNND